MKAILIAFLFFWNHLVLWVVSEGISNQGRAYYLSEICLNCSESVPLFLSEFLLSQPVEVRRKYYRTDFVRLDDIPAWTCAGGLSANTIPFITCIALSLVSFTTYILGLVHFCVRLSWSESLSQESKAWWENLGLQRQHHSTGGRCPCQCRYVRLQMLLWAKWICINVFYIWHTTEESVLNLVKFEW